MRQHVIRGRGCLAQTPALLDSLGIRKPMIVGSQRMAQRLMDAGVSRSAPVFHAYHPNPDFIDCRDGAALFDSEGCDGLVSIGGGSAMDTAKGIKALLICRDDRAALDSAFPQGTQLTHVAIPTSAGTGSEATPFAVLYVDGQKHSLSGDAMLPEGVALDGDLLASLPLLHKKSCALDALCQGVESWWVRSATDESRTHALNAIRGVLASLRPYLQGDPNAAQAMLDAAFESGEAIRFTRTTAAHAMSYQLTKRLGMPHGQSCMLTLPWHTRILLQHPDVRPVLESLAQALSIAADDLPDMMTGLLIDLDLMNTAPVDDALLDALAVSVNAERLGNHPCALTTAQLREIYAAALAQPDDETRRRCLKRWHDVEG